LPVVAVVVLEAQPKPVLLVDLVVPEPCLQDLLLVLEMEVIIRTEQQFLVQLTLDLEVVEQVLPQEMLTEEAMVDLDLFFLHSRIRYK
tara:strand:+ start:384 stop:647 length:264 start_codon:yes stop_codon:yes gene_type:complete